MKKVTIISVLAFSLFFANGAETQRYVTAKGVKKQARLKNQSVKKQKAVPINGDCNKIFLQDNFSDLKPRYNEVPECFRQDYFCCDFKCKYYLSEVALEYYEKEKEVKKYEQKYNSFRGNEVKFFHFCCEYQDVIKDYLEVARRLMHFFHENTSLQILNCKGSLRYDKKITQVQIHETFQLGNGMSNHCVKRITRTNVSCEFKRFENILNGYTFTGFIGNYDWFYVGKNDEQNEVSLCTKNREGKFIFRTVKMKTIQKLSRRYNVEEIIEGLEEKLFDPLRIDACHGYFPVDQNDPMQCYQEPYDQSQYSHKGADEEFKRMQEKERRKKKKHMKDEEEEFESKYSDRMIDEGDQD